MASEFSIVAPVAQETNLISNPSFETGTTGWTAAGSASLARSAAQQKRGVYSLAVTVTAAVYDGCYYAVSLTSGTTYTFSVDVLGGNGVPYLIQFSTTGGVTKASITPTGNGSWQRYVVTWTADATTTFWLMVQKNNSANTSVFYVDGAQCSATASETTYIDGDQIGFYSGDYWWSGTPHASSSARRAYIRAGGRIDNLTTVYGFGVMDMFGLGLANVANVLIPLALLGGSVFQRSVYTERNFTLAGRFVGSSYSDLQTKKKALLALLAPNAYGRDEPAMMLYRPSDDGGYGDYMELPAVYTGGLTGSAAAGRGGGWYERAAISMTMYLPLIIRQGNAGAVLDWQDSMSAGYFAQAKDGKWSNSPSATGGEVRAITKWTNGDSAMYIGGLFTQLDGVANTGYIARYSSLSGTSALGTGMNGGVHAIADGPDGVYVGGDFTSAGGVASTQGLARWSGSAWQSIGTTNGSVYALAFGLDGALYIGGSFTTVAGVTANNIAKYSGGSWTALGTGANGAVQALATDKDGTILVGGYFTTVGGTSYQRIARWNGATWAAVGGSITGTLGVHYVSSIVVAADGSVYIGGRFTNVNGITVSCVAKYANAWSALGSGLNSRVDRMVVADNGIYAFGDFTASGTFALNYSARWNGSAWTYGIDMVPTGALYAAYLGPSDEATVRDRTFVGMSASATVTTNGVTSITNAGSAQTYPKIIFTGPGAVYSLVNATTDERIDFTLTLIAGETATLVTTPGDVTFTSNMRGNILGNIVPGSDLSTFALAPGTNRILTFIAGSTTAATAASMTWRETSASIEGWRP